MSIHKIQYIFYCTALMFLLQGCGFLLVPSSKEATPSMVFEDMAMNIKTRYSLLNDKGINWDEVTENYRAKVYDKMTDDSLFQVLSDFLGELKDGHVNLATAEDRSRNWSWKLDYPANFNATILERNYLGRKHKRTQAFLNTIIDSIGYVYYGSFATSIKRASIDSLFDNMKDTKGLIIDVRHNGGGKLDNCGLLASYFTDTLNDCMQFYYKSGPGPNDFDGPIAYEIKSRDSLAYTKPVVVLMNRSSYSGATFFPAMMSAFPHVTLMGDTSGGGGGIPIVFELPNGWLYRFSTTRTIDCHGRNIEFGVPPDIEVHLNAEDEAKGVDTMIERALAEIKKQTS